MRTCQMMWAHVFWTCCACCTSFMDPAAPRAAGPLDVYEISNVFIFAAAEICFHAQRKVLVDKLKHVTVRH